MSFIEEIKNRARKGIKTIILPESEDKRVLEAASKVTEQGFAKVILLGDEEEILKNSKNYNIDLKGVKIINPLTSEKKEEYKEKLYELRKAKGMTEAQAEELLKEPIYFGMMMLKDETSSADGLVSGAAHSTANTLRPALQILKTAPNKTRYKTCFSIFCNVCTKLRIWRKWNLCIWRLWTKPKSNSRRTFRDCNIIKQKFQTISTKRTKSCNAFIF